MSRPLVFHPDVANEVDHAYRWYETTRAGLGDDFFAALEVVYRAVQATPAMHRDLGEGIRRSMLRRFPYAVYYRVQAERIEVIAVQHGHRDPTAWQSRL